MSEREVEVERSSSTDDQDDIATTFLASRERHDGVNATVKDVTVESALAPVSKPRVVDINRNSVEWYDKPKEELTISDVETTINGQRDVIASKTFGTGSKGVHRPLRENGLRNLIQGKTDSFSGPVVLTSETPESNNVTAQLFDWNYVVTATVTDTGLGREEILQWGFEDESKAQELADSLTEVATGDATAKIEYDDELTLTIEHPQKSRRERLGISDKIDWGDVGMGLWASLMGLTMFGGTSLGLLFIVAGVILALMQFVQYESQPTPENRTVDEVDGSIFTREQLAEEFGDDLFEHGGFTAPVSVAVTQKKTTEGIEFTAVNDDDNRTWTIPVSETGTIEDEDHLAFLNDIGAERLGEENELLLRADVESTEKENDVPTLVDDSGTYRLYPTG